MADLDKLIDLLEKVKQTDPSFSGKATKALDALIGDDEGTSSDLPVDVPPPKKEIKKKRKKKEVKTPSTPAVENPTPAPKPPPPPKHPSVVPLDENHANDVIKGRLLVTNTVARLGLLQQNYESDKEKILDRIDELQESLETYVKSLQKIYNLDANSVYVLRLPENAGENAAFVKRES